MNNETVATRPRKQIELTIDNQALILRSDGSAFLPDTKQLLIADLHLGKDASFRAAGLPVPPGVNAATLKLLTVAIEETAAEEVLILGDLIHNRDSFSDDLDEEFSNWRKNCDCEVQLILGNHDRHAESFPPGWQMKISKSLSIGKLYLCHEAIEGRTDTAGMIQVGGHWHPLATVGRGADAMRLPCFVVDRWQIILPAFGPFKGGMKQARKSGRQLFPIAQSMIWQA